MTPCRAGPSHCAPNLAHFSLRSLQACPSQLSPAGLQSPHDTALTLPGPQGRESRNPPPPGPELNLAAANRYGGLSRGWSAFHRPWPALQEACPTCQPPDTPCHPFPAPTRSPCLNPRARFRVGKPSLHSDGQAVCWEPHPPEMYPGPPVPAQSLGTPLTVSWRTWTVHPAEPLAPVPHRGSHALGTPAQPALTFGEKQLLPVCVRNAGFSCSEVEG